LAFSSLLGLKDDLEERLRPIGAQVFPRQLLLELQDDNLLGQVLKGEKLEPVSIDLPLPPLTCREGQPLEKEPLGDLIGDLLVRDGLLDAYVLASLPDGAVEWRVIDWPMDDVPDDPIEAIRTIDPPLNLSFPLSEATIDLKPLAGPGSRMLLAVSPRQVVDDWIDVFSLAGAQLERLSPAQSCRLAAVSSLLEGAPEEELTLLIHPLPVGARLVLLRRAEPVFNWSLPEGDDELVREVRRCVDFYRRQDPAVGPLRLLMSTSLSCQDRLQDALGVSAETLTADPYGSLVLQGLAMPGRDR
jgi:Tfp pilus assembly PilM family ATPase